MVSGIGGGTVRDVLVMEVRSVLRTELYAVAARRGVHSRGSEVSPTLPEGGSDRGRHLHHRSPSCAPLV